MGSRGTPWLTLEHGFDHVAFDGWTCSGTVGLVFDYWKNGPSNRPAGPGQNQSPEEIRTALKNFAKRKGVKLLVNAFSGFEDPVSSGVVA